VRYPRDGPEYSPAIAFFDATYAVALTLLVTTLEIDNRPSAFTSLSALDRAVGAQFVAFAIAFAVIASYWLMSHRMLASFARSTRGRSSCTSGCSLRSCCCRSPSRRSGTPMSRTCPCPRC
jgi:hypothetical protein